MDETSKKNFNILQGALVEIREASIRQDKEIIALKQVLSQTQQQLESLRVEFFKRLASQPMGSTRGY